MMEQMQQSSKDDDVLNTALLVVHLDSAIELPRGRMTLQEPSPFVLLTVGQVTQESSVRAATTDPTWEQNFRFFVANPNHQSLDIEVRDNKTKKGLGEIRLHLKKLMVAEDMILEQRFPLKDSESGSSVFMTVILRILTPYVTPEWLGSEMNSPEEAVEDAHRRSAPLHAEGSTAAEADPPGDDPVPSTSVAETVPEEAVPSPLPGRDGIQPPASPAPSVSDFRRRKLVSPGSSPESKRDDGGEFGLGRVQLTLRYSAARQQLVLVFHKAVNLTPAEGDSRGLADPYVTMYLLPERDHRTKRKTEVIKKDLNPVFDATFDFAVSAGDLQGRSLEVAVKNETGMFSSSQKLLGTALLDLSSMDVTRAVTQWLDLAPQDALKASTLKYDE